MKDYESLSARLLRAITETQPVVWSPETGWTDDDNEETEQDR